MIRKDALVRFPRLGARHPAWDPTRQRPDLELAMMTTTMVMEMGRAPGGPTKERLDGWAEN